MKIIKIGQPYFYRPMMGFKSMYEQDKLLHKLLKWGYSQFILIERRLMLTIVYQWIFTEYRVNNSRAFRVIS